jgi:hypothetical protein
MNLRIKARPSHVVLLVVGLLIGMLTVGTAVALTSSSFKYSSPKTGKLSLSPSDFTPNGCCGYSWINSWYPPALWGGGIICFDTGVHLPNGSRIISIKFFYKSDNTHDFAGGLWRQNLPTGATSTLAYVQPADDSFTLKSVSKTVPSTLQTVANGTHAYMVGVCPGPYFDGAIITYKYFNAGD